MIRKILGVLVIVLGIISGILFFQAGSALNLEGKELSGIRSVGGTSVAESFYQSMGKFGIAYSTLSYAFGLSIITISLGLGGRMLFDNENLFSEKAGNQNANLDTPKLISCPNCNHTCSAQAISCPKCETQLKGLN